MSDKEYTEEIQIISGQAVTVYGGTKRPIPTYALPGHVTGWLKRNGARTTYAEPTCTCHRVGEPTQSFPEREQSWIAYGDEGWVEDLNALALAHVKNAIERPYMIRPAKGDRTRIADRHRASEQELLEEMQLHGLRFSELRGHIEDLREGRGPLTADDGTRFELASDRSPHRPFEKLGFPSSI